MEKSIHVGRQNPVREIPDTDTIKSVPGFMRQPDTRSEEQKELDAIKAKLEQEHREKRREEARKRQAANNERVDAIVAGANRRWLTKPATRATTAWNTWDGVKAAMNELGVEVHDLGDGRFVASAPAIYAVGESTAVATQLQNRRRSADRLVEVIEKSWGSLVAADKAPTCQVKTCRKHGEYLGFGGSIVCGKHRSGDS